jgi:hypothetical protein
VTNPPAANNPTRKRRCPVGTAEFGGETSHNVE